MRPLILSLFAAASLTACGSVSTTGAGAGVGGTGAGATRAGATVPTDGFETYVTQHNGFTRVRRSETEAGDAAILSQFEDANPASPAGFVSLISMRGTPVANRVHAEIIGEERSWLDGNGNRASALERILRLTADVEDFTPANVARAGGEIVLSGSDYSIVRVGDAINHTNQSDPGTLYLALNFDTETAAIRILNRTVYLHCGGCRPEDHRRIDLLGEDLPFNVQTGAFGGEITGEVYELMVRLGSRTTEVSGTILGQVGGAARDDLVAGGVFEATGTSTSMGTTQEVQVDGVFWASN
jgi:hypothetical protein